MINKLGVFLATAFALLGLIHIYWASGGKLGRNSAVPTIEGKRAFEPTRTGTLLVAGALFAAALVILGQLGFLGDFIPHLIFRAGTFAVSLVFLMRAIGDFNAVGFFKQIKDTPFARMDTRFYSPLCLFFTIAAFLIAWMKG